MSKKWETVQLQEGPEFLFERFRSVRLQVYGEKPRDD